MKSVIISRSDEETIRIMRQLRTIKADTEITALSDYEKILGYFERNPADIAFLDIDDNKTDWQSICGMVKYSDKKIWLILVSDDPFMAVKAFEAGASDFLFKPVGQAQLERTMYKWKNSDRKQHGDSILYT